MPEALTSGGLLLFAVCSSFSISGAQIGLGLALIGFLQRWYRGELRPTLSGMEGSFLVFALAGVFSLSNAGDVGRGVSELRKFLILFPFWIPFWLPLTPDRQRRILLILLTSSSIIAGISVGRFLMNWSDQSRAVGFFSLPLTFGECQSLTIMATIFWLQAGESCRKTRLLLYGALFVQSLAVLASMARSAWVGLLLGILYVFWNRLHRVVPVLAIIGVIFFALASQSEFYRSRFSLSQANDWVRFRIWQMGTSFLVEKPVFGVGMNNIKPLYKTRATDEEREKKWIFGHQHNNFMQFLVMTGFFGFSALCWWLVELGRLCLRLHERITDPWQKDLAAKTFGLFLCFWGSGFTEYSFGDEEVAMLFFFLLGLLANPAREALGSVSGTESRAQGPVPLKGDSLNA
jgi:hypothetical protein